MSYDIIWSPEARTSYLNILIYLDEQWSYSELETFENHTEKVLHLIRHFPEIYEYSSESDTHRCVLTEQITLFYRVKNESETVELLVFWDNRRNPDDLETLK
jgi:plasmid stabilization system protein ParE